MDTTETHIKMCEKARKFLPKWVPKEGDFFCCKGEVHIYQALYKGAEENEDCFPLYRQDQLQEMYRQEHESALAILGDFAYAVLEPKQPKQYHYRGFDSMEQLWLAFVMKEKYNRTWDGESWV